MALGRLCTNVVEALARLRSAFAAELPRARAAGLHLVAPRQEVDRPADVTGGDYHWLPGLA